MLALLIDSLRAFKLAPADIMIRLSSRKAWHEFFALNGGQAENEYEFYQVIDKLEREETAVSEQKLAAVGFSLSAVKGFIEAAEPTTELQSIIENLAARGLADYVKIDYGVIRGLAYYTGVVFEAFDRTGEFRAIAGGGRYDNLVQLISGGKVNLPALGFGMGDVVLLELLKARKLLPVFNAQVEVFCLIENESRRAESLKIIQELRSSGFATEYALTAAKPDKQFKRAQELKAAFTVRLEQAAGGEVMARIRSLATRQEVLCTPGLAVEELRKARGLVRE